MIWYLRKTFSQVLCLWRYRKIRKNNKKENNKKKIKNFSVGFVENFEFEIFDISIKLQILIILN